jgi:hypothetical protein
MMERSSTSSWPLSRSSATSRADEAGFPADEAGFPANEAGFPANEAGFPAGVAGFPAGEVVFAAGVAGFPSREAAASPEVRARRDAALSDVSGVQRRRVGSALSAASAVRSLTPSR